MATHSHPPSNFTSSSPKRPRGQAEVWYPYYAGFSATFVKEVLDRLSLPADAVILDPWNGSGTTTACAALRGYASIGIDINPAMCLIAAGRVATRTAVDQSVSRFVLPPIVNDAHDPLSFWFSNRSASFLRGLTGALLHAAPNGQDRARSDATRIGFHFTALALTLRRLLSHDTSSNPTWFRSHHTTLKRSSPSSRRITSILDESIRTLQTKLPTDSPLPRPRLYRGDSRCLPLLNESIDAIISSPPYCTRLDYPIATQPELALLGEARRSASFRKLRDVSLGTPTVGAEIPAVTKSWGASCISLLEKVATHRSKASATYYLKTYRQYFAGLHDSLCEITRVARGAARCILVVQSSWYKDIRVDLPLITVEMMDSLGWRLLRRSDYSVRYTLADTNPASRDYRTETGAVESSLDFTKRTDLRGASSDKTAGRIHPAAADLEVRSRYGTEERK